MPFKINSKCSEASVVEALVDFSSSQDFTALLSQVGLYLCIARDNSTLLSCLWSCQCYLQADRFLYRPSTSSYLLSYQTFSYHLPPLNSTVDNKNVHSTFMKFHLLIHISFFSADNHSTSSV